MSSVDNRIVQMQFENSQFEKGVKESLKSIEELEKSLEFKDAEKGLAALQKAGDSFSLAKMADSIQKIEQRFSVMGIVGKRIIEDITDSAVRMGEQFIKSVTTDQISEGWDKYAKKTEAVQTIIAATGKDIGYVEAQLEKLNWFTDETSYDFVDMTSNIGKFTSMGIDLETSVTAMQGIATWAAVSGQNAQTASRAMYNMSQAIGVGSVKLMDWKSIENANMATKEFKQTAIDTAKALGKLNKQGKTAKGTAVTFENFSQTLSEGWFTKDVLLKTLDKYGEYANKVYEIATEKGIPASEAMKLITDDTMKLGEKAFKAAQEAKTFADAINSVKDAVSTGWMNIFQDIFGNYEEAKELWTDLANYLWDMFAAPLSNTHELLAEWSKLGGRKELLQGIYDIFEGIANIVQTVKDALEVVFPPITVDNLLNLSHAVAEFGENFKETFSRTEEVDGIVYKKIVDPVKQLIEEGNFALNQTGENVKELQQKLVELGWLEEEYANGIYNPATQKAVEDFNSGLDQTSKLLKTSLKIGDKGKEVEEFQKKLKELGFDPGAVDGIWGKKTQKAFDDYKASLGKTETAYKELHKGMKGEDVKRLQQALIDAKLLDEGQADGIFGPKTEAALKKYQKAKGVTESGILDEKTFKQLFPDFSGVTDEYEQEYTYVTKYSNTLENLKRIVSGASAALHIFTSFFGFLGKVIGHVGSLLMPLVNAFTAIGAAVGDSIVAFDKWLQETGVFDQWFENVKKFLEPFGKWVESAAHGLLSFFGLTNDASDSAKEMMTFPKLYENIKNAIKKSGIIDKVTASWNNLKKTFENVIPSIKKAWKTFKESLGTKFQSFMASLPGVISSVTEWLGNLASKGLELITPWIQKIPSAIDKVKGFWAALTQKGDSESGKAPGFLARVKEGFQSVIDYLFGEGDITNGKQPGLFRKIGKLLSGDIDGFTEGMDDETKQQVLDKIQGVKDFIQKVREAIIVLFGGELGDDKKISDDTIKKINDFKDSIASVFEGIALLFTGKVQENSKLSKETRDKIIGVRDTIIGIAELIGKALSDMWHTITGIFTGEVTFESVGDFFASFWESIKQFFSDAYGITSSTLGNVGKGISDFFNGLMNFIKSAGKWLLIGYGIYKIGDMVRSVTRSFDSLADVIKSYKKTSQPLSRTILEFAGAIALIAGSIWLIGQLDPEQFTRGVFAVGGIVAAILILVGIASAIKADKAKTIAKIGQAIWDFAKAIGVLALTIVVLSVIPWKTFINGFAKVAIICWLMIRVIKKLNKAGATKLEMKGIMGLAIAIGILALVVGLMGHYKWETIGKGLVGLYGIVFILRGLFKTIGKWGATKIKLTGMLGLAALIVVMALVVAELGKLDGKTLLKGLASLYVIGLVLRRVFKTLGESKAPKLGTLIAGIVVLGLAMAGLVIALQYVKDIDYKVILSFALGLSAIMVAMGLMAKLSVGATFSGVTAAAVGLAEIIVAIGVVVAAFAGLNKIPGFKEFMESGAEVLGSVFGTLAGAFVGAFNKNGINAFGEGMDTLSELPDADPEGVQNAIEQATLLQQFSEGLPAKEVFTKIVDSIFGGEFKQFSKDMGTFGTEFNKFATQINSVESWDDLDTHTESAIAIASAIRDFAISLPPKATVEKILGRVGASEFANFSRDMGTFGEQFNKFAGEINNIESWEGLDTKAQTAVSIATIIKDFATSLPSKTIFENLLGRVGASEFANFSRDMGTFGEQFNKFAGEINNIESWEGLDTKAQTAVIIATTIKDFATNLPEKTAANKILDGIGASEFASFARDMGTFGTQFNNFAGELSKVDDFTNLETKAKNAVIIATTIKDFATSLPEKSNATKIIDGLWFTKTEFQQFNSDMPEFASAFNNFATEMSKVEHSEKLETDTGNAIKIATQVAGFIDSLSGLNIETKKDGILGWFQDETKQSTVFDAIAELGSSMVTNKDSFKGLGEGSFTNDIKAATKAAMYVAGFLNYISGDDFKVTDNVDQGWQGYTSSFDILSQNIGTLGDRMKEFGEKTEGIDLNAISAAVESVTGFLNLVTKGTPEVDTNGILSFLDSKDISEKLASIVTTVSQEFTNAGLDLATSVSDGLAAGDLSNGINSLITDTVHKLDSQSKVFEIPGGNFAIGLANGIAFNAYVAVEAAREIARRMVEAVNRAFDSHSPSRVAQKIGGYFTEGLAIGTTDKVNEATNAAEKVAGSMLSSASGTLATLSSLLADDIDVNPVISPVVDLTNARQSAAMIGGLFGNQSIGVTSSVLAKDAMVSTNNGRPITIQNGTMSTTESLSGVTDQLNTLASYLTARNDGPQLSEMQVLGEKFGDLADAVSNLKIVLDTGTLVGEITPALDAGLGNYATLRDRGN